MARVILIHVLSQSGSTRVESYVNSVAGRNAARDSLRYHLQMCLQGDSKAVTMYAEDATPEMVRISHGGTQ